MPKFTALFILAVFFAFGCNRSGDENAIVARVGEKNLTWEELKAVIPDNANAADSTTLAERYIEDWVREQVVINQAELLLSEEKKNFDELIENYRRSLLTYTYEQEWVKQKLDTVVSKEEIEKYYTDNLQNFQLKDYIVKVKFTAISNENKQIKLLKKLFFSEDPEDLVKWEKFCVDNGASYFFDEDHWMLWDDFIKQIPLEVYDVESFLKRNKTTEFEKDNNLYLIAITDYQLSGSQSPLSFEQEKIKTMIINRRKLDLVSRMREDLYNKAVNEKTVEIFYKK
jgi:hypothetical protein